VRVALAVLLAMLALGGSVSPSSAGCCTPVYATGPQWLPGDARILYSYSSSASSGSVATTSVARRQEVGVLLGADAASLSPDGRTVVAIE
jgi:hypothetical protein